MESANEAWIHPIKRLGYIADRENVLDPLWDDILSMDSYDPIANQMVVDEKYEIAFGIQTTINPSPISLVTCNENTELHVGGEMDRLISKLLKDKVPELTNMSLLDLINLPTPLLKSFYRGVKSVALQDTKLKKELELLKDQLNR